MDTRTIAAPPPSSIEELEQKEIIKVTNNDSKTSNMANDMCTRRLRQELQSIQKNVLTNPTVHTVPLDTNIREWHYVIEGHANTPYEGGYYWGKLIFPKEYPMKPPSVIMLTPNGRFKTGRRLCLSMSDFHPESWNPMWSVSTIITGLVSFMAESSPTTGSIETSADQKKKFARLSLENNVKDATFTKLFPHLVTLHNDQMEKRTDLGSRWYSLKKRMSLFKSFS